MTMTAAQARAWIGQFEAAEQLDQQTVRAEGAQSERSVALSLSLLETVTRANGGTPPLDPRREAREEAVRRVWARLRARLRR